MRTSPAEKDNKILQVIFFLRDKVITCGDTQHLLYEANDLAFFSLTRDRLPETGTLSAIKRTICVTLTSIIV